VGDRPRPQRVGDEEALRGEDGEGTRDERESGLPGTAVAAHGEGEQPQAQETAHEQEAEADVVCMDHSGALTRRHGTDRKAWRGDAPTGRVDPIVCEEVLWEAFLTPLLFRHAMERRVALLRAVNVGGTGTLKMERLLQIVKTLGWQDASTLGASGNVLYTAGRTQPATDAARLADALAKDLGQPPTVIMRSRTELEAVIKAEPFARADAKIPTKWWFVGLLAAERHGAIPEVLPGVPLAYAGRLPREVCWTMSGPDRRAIDLPKRIEKALGVAMTVRNWNVVNRIAERLGA
jgi:uncharacterized protein (DUF1697 family)